MRDRKTGDSVETFPTIVTQTRDCNRYFTEWDFIVMVNEGEGDGETEFLRTLRFSGQSL